MRCAMPCSKRSKCSGRLMLAHAQMKIMDDVGIHLGQTPRQEVGLLLILPFQSHPVSGNKECFQSLHDMLSRKQPSPGQGRNTGETPRFFCASGSPPGRDCMVHRSPYLSYTTPLVLSELKPHLVIESSFCYSSPDMKRER